MMMPTEQRWKVLVAAGAAVVMMMMGAATASAQPLGTFSWQLQPYCNVVTVNVVQTGAVYTMDGWDDQCGAATRAPLVGTATLNPNGSIGFGLNITTTPGGAPVAVDATLNAGSFSGSWRDSGGHQGTFVFGGTAAGSPRPPAPTARIGDITAVAAGTGLTGGGTSGDVALAVNPAVVQTRVGGTCAAGQAVRTIGQDGTVTCEPVAGGAGDITSVTADTGLTGGGTSGDVSLAVDFAGSGATSTAARSDHTHAAAGSSNTGVGESALVNNTSGSGNTAIGYTALVATTTGYDNTASGDRALQANTTGFRNTATGAGALAANTAGIFNTASGYRALHANTTGNDNTASGFQALYSNITGNGNTATGSGALTANTTAGYNTAVGYAALASSTTGGLNAAVGSGALALNTTGSENTAVGASALAANTTGIGNAAVGRRALAANTEGEYNSAFGRRALDSNTTGSANTAIGQFALGFNSTGSSNTVVGSAALGSLTDGYGNVAIGTSAGVGLTSGSYNVYIATENTPSGSEDNTIRIGSAIQTRNFAAGIRGVTTGTADAIPVVIDSNGQLGTISSSRRFKEDIRDMGEASRRLWQLRPVTFRYTQAYTDGSKPVHYGLVAEEVAAVFPELAVTNASGGVDTVHYETLSVLLLNEVQRLERDRTALTARLERERAAMAAELADLRAAVAALTATTGKQ